MGEQQNRDFSERYSRERDIIIICTFYNSQPWLTTPPPARWNSLRLKIQRNVRQRKSCNYPFRDFVFQIFISEVLSWYASSLFLWKRSCLFSFMWVSTRCWNIFTRSHIQLVTLNHASLWMCVWRPQTSLQLLRCLLMGVLWINQSKCYPFFFYILAGWKSTEHSFYRYCSATPGLDNVIS